MFLRCGSRRVCWGSFSWGCSLFWLVRRSVEIWRNAPPRGASELDWSLARAATIVVALSSSFLRDYPLRTGAMMAIMAFACALLIEPPAGAERTEELKPQLGRAASRHAANTPTFPRVQRLEPPATGPSIHRSITRAPSTMGRRHGMAQGVVQARKPSHRRKMRCPSLSHPAAQ